MSKENKRTAKTAPEAVRILWDEGFFKSWRNSKIISETLSRRGNNFSPRELGIALVRADYLTRRGKRGALEYIQKRPAAGKEIESIEEKLFTDALIQKLKKSFSTELADLHLNFGKSGNCTAFLLRKILEKLIYIVFSKHGIETKLEDRTKPGGLVGLETMINIASSEKIHGIPFLTSKTAKAVKGIKFLGDVAAHNPLINVDMKTIIPQMPYIITAYEELSKKL